MHHHMYEDLDAQNKVIESFRLELDGFEQAFEADDLAEYLESKLIEHLENPVRILRWAVVDCDGSHFCCEGAYLKKRA